jgi:hypothetical protein
MNRAPTPLARATGEATLIPLPEDLERAHDALEQCALILERIDSPPMDLTAAVTALELAFDRLYASYRGVEDPAECVPAAQAALATFQSELARDAGHPMLSMVRDMASSAERHLNEAEMRLRAAPWAPPPPLGELRASLRQPRLHALERPNLVAKVRVAKAPLPEVQSPLPEIPTPTTFEELAAAVAGLRGRSAARARPPAETPADASAAIVPAEVAPNPFASSAEKAWSRRRFSEERALGAFEEVLLAWIQRLPIAGERWQSAIFIEQRLLSGIDALAALGPAALAHLDTLTLGNPTSTPAHLSALTLVLGSIDGRDTLALAERLLHEQESVSPEWAEAFGAALALVPHPDASRLAFRYAYSPHLAHRALGIRALVRRGVFDRELLERAALDEPLVAAEALPTFARITTRDEARVVLDHAIERSEEDATLRAATLRAASANCHLSAEALLLHDFQSKDSADAGILLAQNSGRSGANKILEWVRPRPTAAGAEALGWTGLVEAVPVLIGALASPDEPIQAACAEALERITGARLLEEVEIQPERIMDPDVPDPVPDDKPPLARQVSSPRDQPEAGSPDRIERITRDPQRWRAWWAQNGGNFERNQRYRRGYPWSPHIVWTELGRALATPSDRRWLKHELSLRTDALVLCDPHDFVAHQELVLAAFEPTAIASRGTPGSWSEAQRR